MITKCLLKDEKRILDYIGLDYAKCLYLYLDFRKYGLNSEIASVYLQQDGDMITSILLKYYSCLHVYSKEDSFNANEIAAFFNDNGFTMLYCTEDIAEKVYSELPNAVKEAATITRGHVAQIKELDEKPLGLAKTAEREDFDQIVRLIYDDEDIGKSYKYEDLAKQLEERNIEGYARNLVIRQNNLVIAHACTNAELNNIAVVAELLVRKEYRRQGYASEIWRSICDELLLENKEVYSFYYSEESKRLHEKIGFFEVCRWAKIVIA